MIKTTVEFLQSLIVLICILAVTDLVIKLFLRRTFVGRLIATILKDFWLVFKHSLKITKNTTKVLYKYGKKLYEYLDKLYQKRNETKQEQIQVKQVVNNEANNVIDLKKFIAEKQQIKSK